MKHLFTLVGLLLLLCGVSVPLLAQTATGAGELVSATPVLDANRTQVTEFGPVAPANTGATYYRVTYTTPDIEGVLDTVSGLLVVPQRGDIAMAMAVYQRGTPFSKQNLASNLSATDAVFAASALAGQGMITLVPDYLGMGEARGFHPYLDAESEAWVAVDMLYAVESWLVDNDLDWNGQLFVSGYSQGGHAALALHRMLQAEYAEDWPVTASVPMSGAYDLPANLPLLTDPAVAYPVLELPVFLLLGLQESEGDIYTDLAEVFEPEYLPGVELFLSAAWEDGTITLDTIRDRLIGTMLPLEGDLFPARMFRSEFRDAVLADSDHPLQRAMRDNSPLDWTPQAPMRLFYCADDNVVNPIATLNAEAALSTPENDVSVVNGGPGLDHIQCIGPAMGFAVQFFGGFRTDAGRFVPNGFVHDDSLRTYVTYVPPSYDGSEEWPVVLHLQESNAPLEAYIATVNAVAVADTAEFLVVYPAPLSSFILAVNGEGPIWNDGTPFYMGDADDLGFFDKLIDRLASDYSVDLSRVYATGAGSGGAMAARLGCEMPDRIAAIANVQGFITCQPPTTVPGLFMYNTADPFIPEEGIPGVLPPFIEGPEGWAAANGCAAEPTETMLPDLDPTDGSTVTVFEYPECTDNSEVLYYRIAGAGRTWPGGLPIPDSGAPANQDIDGDVEVWNFFRRHTLADPAPAARRFDLTLQDQDSTRNYILYVPAAYDCSEPWPLVLNLHGLASNRFEQEILTQMHDVADTAHFILVYPEAAPGPQPAGGFAPTWNVLQLPDRADDVVFLTRLVDTLARDWAIDANRVYATGLSQGGVMSYRLAQLASDRFAAIASVAGILTLDLPWEQGTDRPFPVLQMHGTADIVAPYDGGTGVLSPDLMFPPVREQVGSWLTANGCALDSTVVAVPDVRPDDNSTVEIRRFQDCTVYTGTDNGERSAEVWFYTIEGGGHSWPGAPVAAIPPGVLPLLSPINQDIDASVEIWNFFNRHTLDITVDTEEPAPDVFQLTAYPNPAASRLTFEFALPQAAPVELTLFNGLGQPVGVLTSATLPAGPQRIVWQRPRSVPAGMYYYRLRVGARQVVRSVVLTE